MLYLPTWMVDFYGFHVGKYISCGLPLVYTAQERERRCAGFIVWVSVCKYTSPMDAIWQRNITRFLGKWLSHCKDPPLTNMTKMPQDIGAQLPRQRLSTFRPWGRGRKTWRQEKKYGKKHVETSHPQVIGLLGKSLSLGYTLILWVKLLVGGFKYSLT